MSSYVLRASSKDTFEGIPALEYFIAGRHLRCHLEKPVFYDEEAEFGNYWGVGARLRGVSETTPALDGQLLPPPHAASHCEQPAHAWCLESNCHFC